MLQRLLRDPLAADIDIDSPEAARVRAAIVRAKPLLKKIYEEWYAAIRDAVSGTPAPVLEIGSAGGFLQDFVPDVVRTDIMPCPVWTQSWTASRCRSLTVRSARS